jgi:hypothetical protein
MKLMAILFLCLLPANSNGIGSVGCLDVSNGCIEPYVLMSKDVTKVNLDFQRHLLIVKQKSSPDTIFGFGPRPLIAHKHVLSSRDGMPFPLQHANQKDKWDKHYAILPINRSSSNLKKRLFEMVLQRGVGKERSSYY